MTSDTYKGMMDESITLGDEGERTFDVFFAERFDELSRLAFLLTGASAVADEIAQDACEEVFRRWEYIDSPSGVRPVGGDQWRSRGAGDAPDNGSTWNRLVRFRRSTPTRSLSATCWVTCHTLNEKVLVLRFYADLKVDDIARELGTADRARSNHTFDRGLTRMHKELS